MKPSAVLCRSLCDRSSLAASLTRNTIHSLALGSGRYSIPPAEQGLKMATNGESLVVRELTRDDAGPLLALLGHEHGTINAKITRASLERDLSWSQELEMMNDAQQVLAQNDDPTLELDLELVKSNVPATRGFLALVNDQPLGVLLFHYFFSPWSGHRVHLNHIYVLPAHRNKGIATRLLEEMRALCRRESIKKLLYETSKISPSLLERIAQYGSYVYRDDSTDWSIFRMDFDKS